MMIQAERQPKRLASFLLLVTDLVTAYLEASTDEAILSPKSGGSVAFGYPLATRQKESS